MVILGKESNLVCEITIWEWNLSVDLGEFDAQVRVLFSLGQLTGLSGSDLSTILSME